MRNKIEIGEHFTIMTNEDKDGNKEIVVQNDNYEIVVIKGRVLDFYHKIQKEIKDNF